MGSLFSKEVENPLNNVMFAPQQVSHNYLNRSDKSDVKFIQSKNGNRITFQIIVPNISDPKYTRMEQKYIIWSHGNASSIFDMRDYLKYLSNKLNVCVVIYDYQGYGLSEGTPSEQKCYEDHETIVDYMINIMKIRRRNLILVGQSIGTGIVVDYIHKNKWKYPVILISPYTDIISIASDHMSCGKYGTSSIRYITNPFSSLDKIKDNVATPVKIIHGEDDSVINVQHGKTLYANLKNKSLTSNWLKNTDHNDILMKIPLEHYLEVVNYV